MVFLPPSWPRMVALFPMFFLLMGGGLFCSDRGEEEKSSPTQSRERIRISGSAAVLPLVTLLVREFERQHPEIEIAMLPCAHTRGGLAGVREGELDIGLTSRSFSRDEWHNSLQYFHLAQDGIAFVTQESEGIKDISSEQLRGIYSGRIANWKQLGGVDAPIRVLDRPEHTSAKITLRRQLFGSELAISSEATVIERPHQVIDSLLRIPHAIGYTSLGEVLSSEVDVAIMSVDGVPPTPSNIKKNLYVFSRPLGMAISREPSKRVMKFIDFAYKQSGLNIIESNGYVPILGQFVIATIPERNVIKQEERYRPLIDHLSEKMGINAKIALKQVSSYQGTVDDLVSGRVNAAFLGSFGYALADAKVGVEALARPVKDGVSHYRGLIFTRKDSGIHGWEDLKGRSFAMIEATTAGELFPKVLLKRHGINDYMHFLGKIHYVGSHDSSILKVLYGEVDAGAAKDLVFQKLARENPRIKDQLRIIARSKPVPENALVVRKDVDFVCFKCHAGLEMGAEHPPNQKGYAIDLKEKLRAALLGLQDSVEGRTALKAFCADRFIATTREEYKELDLMIAELGLDLSTYPLHAKRPCASESAREPFPPED